MKFLELIPDLADSHSDSHLEGVGNVLQEIEIDAEATAQIVLSCEYGLTYKHPDDTIQALIEEYILSRKILEA